MCRYFGGSFQKKASVGGYCGTTILEKDSTGQQRNQQHVFFWYWFANRGLSSMDSSLMQIGSDLEARNNPRTHLSFFHNANQIFSKKSARSFSDSCRFANFFPSLEAWPPLELWAAWRFMGVGSRRQLQNFFKLLM